MKNNFNIIVLCFMIIACNNKSNIDQEEKGRWWTEEERTFIVMELNRSTNELQSEIENLTHSQWIFREDETRWSIAKIVEHLELQNKLHYREISVISKSPEHLKFRAITNGQDHYFSNYSTDTTKSKSQWYLNPNGAYDSIKKGWLAFYKARNELKILVEKTAIDFRKQFTFRVPVQGKEIKDLKIGQVRDLHQLLLTGIAHTDRHIVQIKKIKLHPNYPIETEKNTIE